MVSSESRSAPLAASNLILSFLEKNCQESDHSSKKNVSSPQSDDHGTAIPVKINGWKPSTTLSLLAPTRTIEACDIIDHSFGRMFLESLRAEIHSTNILSRLKPARTAMDNQVEKLMNKLGPLDSNNISISPFLNNPSDEGMKTGIAKVRGDKSVIIPRSFRSTEKFRSNYPNIFRLISSIEQTVQGNLHEIRNNKSSCRIELDTSMTSMQLASYPGDGVSGYARHCDVGSFCKEEIDSSTSTHTGALGPQRIITAIYYITEDDWSPDEDGGCLRIFDKHASSGSHDIVPYADRLVIFRSDLVEHEVLPSLKRNRLAITVWLYGQILTGNGDAYVEEDVTSELDVKKTPPQSSSLSTRCSPLPMPTTLDPPHPKKTIFVSIPSYRDTETHPTILSLIANAAFPERIMIGVVYQYDTSSQYERALYEEGLTGTSCTNWTPRTNLRTLTLDYKSATGPCYARFLAQSLHRGEDYILQIDSHMRFRPNWDVYLIEQISKCPNPRKSVLTTYPPGYHLPNEIPDETRPTILAPWKFDYNQMLRQKGRLLKTPNNEKWGASENEYDSTNNNIPCLLYAGGFNFAMANVVQECPYEKLHHLFFGEELNMAVRLYTHGYNLYAPPETVCYHLWSRDHRTTFQADIGTALHVPDQHNESKRSSSEEAASVSRETVRRRLLGNGEDCELGNIRTVKEFADALGVDFANGIICQNAECAGLDTECFV